MSANSQTVPNAGLVTFAKFDITAGSEDAAISTIKLERQGLSNRSDIDRVYFEQNSKRISSRGSVNIDDEVTVSFTPALVVKAGSTETIDLVVQLDGPATVGAEHRFALVEVESSTDVANNLPVVTNTMRLGSYTVSNVTFDATDLGGTNEINVGDSDVIIGEFELSTVGDKDNLFKSVTFTNNGGSDMESVFANIGLYNDGVEVSTEVMIEGREITFIVNHEIENGRTELYEIRADLVSTDRDGDDFELELRNTTDLNVVELDTNFSAPIVTAVDTMTEYVLVGGELLLTRDSEYTNTDTVSSSTNDVVLLAAKLNVDEAITVEDLSLNYTTTTASLNAQYRDLKLVVDGRTISTYTPKSTAWHADATPGRGTVEFDGTFLVDANSSIKVLGNLQNNVNNNSTFVFDSFVLNETTTNDMRYVSNDEEVTSIPGSVQAVTVTVAGSTLLATKNDGLSNNETVIAGSRDVELFGFSLRANDVSDVKVTSLRPVATYLTETATVGGLTVKSVNTNNRTVTIEKIDDADLGGDSATATAALNWNDITITFQNDSNAVNPQTITVEDLKDAIVAANILDVDNNVEVFATVATPGNAVAVAKTELVESLDLANITNVRLYEGTTLLKTENDFEFNSLNVVIPKNGAKSFRIVADFDNSVGSDANLQLSLGNNQVSARNMESNQLISLSNGAALTSSSFVFAGQGTLAVDLNTSTKDATILTPSDSETDVFSFDLEANDDTLKLTDLYITDTEGNVDLPSAVRSASITVNGRTIDGSVVGDSTIYFPIGNSSPVVLEKDEISTVEVNLAFNDSDTRTSADLTFAIGAEAGLALVNGTSKGIRVLSDSTGLELTFANAFAATSNTHKLARSKVTVSDSNFTASANNLYEFTVTADANRKVSLTDINFDIDGSADLSGGTITVYKNTESNANVAFTIDDQGVVTVWNISNREISAGTSQKYIVKLTGVTNAYANVAAGQSASRETRIDSLSFLTDVNGDVAIDTADLNVGVPTTTSSYTYE